MKLTVVADQGGKILSITQFGDVGDKVSGITKAGVEAGKGHSVHEVEIPRELEKTPLLDIHKGYKLDLKSKQLVKA